MKVPGALVGYCFTFLFALMPLGIALAHDNQGHNKMNNGAGVVRKMTESHAPLTISKAEIKLPDVELLDQNGSSVRFVSDVIKDRLVVIGFIYTSCGTVCPILSSIFSKLQNEMVDQLGGDLLLISISVDPATDIPERLKEYSRRYDAGTGWTFLTGEKKNIDRVLTALGSYSFDITEHPSSVLVGNPGAGEWVRLYGFPGTHQIESALNSLTAAGR